MDNINLLEDLPKETLAGRRVLLRLDLNVPVAEGQITEDFRLRRALPTVQFLKERGAKIVILSHLGSDGHQSLQPVADYFNRIETVAPVKFFSTIPTPDQLGEESVVMIENLRQETGEATNDPIFVERLAALGDIFVNDGFAVAHRFHASIVGLPKLLPSFLGPLFAEEIKNLSQAFAPPHPFVLLLGGAKFSTKLPLVKKFLPLADGIFIYGALAHAFFKELGYETGQSLVEKDTSTVRPFLNEPKIYLPTDVRVKNGEIIEMKYPDALLRDDTIMDVGPDSVEHFREVAAAAKMILWNGPLGRFEYGFRGSTDGVAKLIAGNKNARTIVGGGDTIAAIETLRLFDQFSFLSTGGGAMLDFLAIGTLPGLEAIRSCSHRLS